MSDDFVRLVSQANPASRQQYQPANGGYPPSSSPPHAMDPFFDDDDDVPDSAFGRPAAMQSKESGLPLARSGAPPAGFGNSQLSLPTTIPPDSWSFDDDQPSSKPFTGSASFPGPSGSGSAPQKHKRAPSKSFKKRLGDIKWPWQRKEKVLTGNRVIALNNPEANAEFCNNYVSTSKYNLASFVPKFLLGASPVSCARRSHLPAATFLARAPSPASALVSPLRARLARPTSQSNSRNTPICSSSSPPSSSRYPTFPQQINIRPLPRSLLYYLHQRSRRLRRTW